MYYEPQPFYSSDPFKILKITLNSNGSLTSQDTLYPLSPITPQLTAQSQLTPSKDIPLNTKNDTFISLYCPASPPKLKLPVIIYFHGGGFIIVSALGAPIHLACSEISAHTPAIVISVEYRLASKHCLPAAYEDGVDVIVASRPSFTNCTDGSDEWLTEMSYFSNVYLKGLGAGGNLALNAGLRSLNIDRDPITIVGLMIGQPFLVRWRILKRNFGSKCSIRVHYIDPMVDRQRLC